LSSDFKKISSHGNVEISDKHVVT